MIKGLDAETTKPFFAAQKINSPESARILVAGGEKSFDFAEDRMGTYKGKADFYNLKKVSERGQTSAGSRIP